MNIVILSGRMVKDPEVQMTQNGKKLCRGTLAVARESKNERGEYESDFIDIVVWGKIADFVEMSVRKGQFLEIQGRWTQRKWQTKNGESRVTHECLVDKLKKINTALSSTSNEPTINTPYPREQDETPSKNDIPYDDDLPF